MLRKDPRHIRPIVGLADLSLLLVLSRRHRRPAETHRALENGKHSPGAQYVINAATGMMTKSARDHLDVGLGVRT